MLFARMDDRMGMPGSDHVMASACVVGPFIVRHAHPKEAAEGADHRRDGLIGRDVIEQLLSHWSVTDIAGGDFDGANLQRFFVDAHAYLAPNRALRAALCPAVQT